MTKVVKITKNEPIAQIVSWFNKAVPTPQNKNIHTQIGVHLEEVAEMLDVLKLAGESQESCEKLSFVADVVHYMATQLKAGDLTVDLEKVDKTQLLDALCDQIVTASGTGHMFGFDLEAGLKEVANSNDSKFDENGKPIFNEQMKIIKGPNYFKPKLERYV